MKSLNTKEIQSIALGVAYASEEADGLFLHRFTPAQEEAYRSTSDEFYMKSSASAGIRLVFETDSEKLKLDILNSPGSKCRWFGLDVYAGDDFVGGIDNIEELGGISGAHSATFALGQGIKTVRIYMPWGACAKIQMLALDDGAFITPVRPRKKMLIFGDSITQGITSYRPSSSYAVRLSEMLDADARNKGIGGEVFFPALAQCTDEQDFAPDYITVAYGTNDWGKKTAEQYRADVRAFYGALSSQYPDAQIFAITPIWRADYMEERPFGLFESLEEIIRNETADLNNVTVISGWNLVPHDIALFRDERLHPNDEGFKYYAENLYAELKKHLKEEK